MVLNGDTHRRDIKRLREESAVGMRRVYRHRSNGDIDSSFIDIRHHIVIGSSHKVIIDAQRIGDVIPKFYRQTANLAIFNNDKRRTVSHSNRQLITFRTKRET